MRYSQYLRLERIAGGVGASNKDFIKACHSVLKNKYSLVERDARHKWIRDDSNNSYTRHTSLHNNLFNNGGIKECNICFTIKKSFTILVTT